MLRRNLGLDAAPGAPVPGNDDLPLHVDPAQGKLLVVLRDTVIDVHELASHVAVARVAIVQRKLFGCLA